MFDVIVIIVGTKTQLDVGLEVGFIQDPNSRLVGDMVMIALTRNYYHDLTLLY